MQKERGKRAEGTHQLSCTSVPSSLVGNIITDLLKIRSDIFVKFQDLLNLHLTKVWEADVIYAAAKLSKLLVVCVRRLLWQVLDYCGGQDSWDENCLARPGG